MQSSAKDENEAANSSSSSTESFVGAISSEKNSGGKEKKGTRGGGTDRGALRPKDFACPAVETSIQEEPRANQEQAGGNKPAGFAQTEGETGVDGRISLPGKIEKAQQEQQPDNNSDDKASFVSSSPSPTSLSPPLVDVAPHNPHQSKNDVSLGTRAVSAPAMERGGLTIPQNTILGTEAALAPAQETASMKEGQATQHSQMASPPAESLAGISLQQITAAVLPTVVRSLRASSPRSSVLAESPSHSAAHSLTTPGSVALGPVVPGPPQSKAGAAVVGAGHIMGTTTTTTSQRPADASFVQANATAVIPALRRTSAKRGTAARRKRSNSMPESPAEGLPSAPSVRVAASPNFQPLPPAASVVIPAPSPLSLPTPISVAPSLVVPPFLGAPGGAPGPATSTATTRPPLRRGKWTVEEEAYVARVIQEFNSGYLNAPAGATLRTYLSERLHCDPMRITKKFTGDACIGKRVFHPAVRCATNAAAIDKARAELDALERRWRRRLELQQKESAKKAAASAAAAAAAASTGRHQSTPTQTTSRIQPNLRASATVAASPIPVTCAAAPAFPSPEAKEQIVTQTASWLERANAILSRKPVPSLTYSRSSASQAAQIQPNNSVETQMKEVQRLISEGPTIQRSSAGLSGLCAASPAPSQKELHRSQSAEAALGPSKRKVSNDHDAPQPTPSSLPSSMNNLGAAYTDRTSSLAQPTVQAAPTILPSYGTCPHPPSETVIPSSATSVYSSIGEKDDKRPRRLSPPRPELSGVAAIDSSSLTDGAAEGAEALVGFLNSVRAQSYKAAAAASAAPPAGRHLSG